MWALDLVGNGRSDKPAAPYTIAYFSNFVRDFLSTQGLDRVGLVGSSLGGTVTLDFAIRHPEFQTGIDSGWGRLPSRAMRCALSITINPPNSPRTPTKIMI